MNLLAIETTGAKASAALIDENGALTVQRSDKTMNHLQHLIPMIEQLLSNCGMIIDDVSVIAVSEGPGSFTGIRIGMATAKALAQVRRIPVISVPTLKSFAYHLPGYGGLVCPVFDAKRNQVYAGIYLMDGHHNCHQLLADGAYELPDYVEGLKGAVKKAVALMEKDGVHDLGEAAPCEERNERKALGIMVFGDGIASYGERIQKAVEDWKISENCISAKNDICLEFAKEEKRCQDAASVAVLGRIMEEQGAGKSLHELHPVYLRKAEAERKLEEAAKNQHG